MSDKPDKTNEPAVTVEINATIGLVLAAAILATVGATVGAHIAHDFAFLACLRDGNPSAMCHEWTDTDPRDTDGHGLAGVLLEAVGR